MYNVKTKDGAAVVSKSSRTEGRKKCRRNGRTTSFDEACCRRDVVEGESKKVVE